MTATHETRNLLLKGLLIFGLPVVIVAVFSLASLSRPTSGRATELAPLSDLPQFVHEARPEAQHAYRFAAANPDLVRHFPCYCGCVYMGHQNNLDCYIQEIKEDGTIVFDEHAAACGICVEITIDVMALWAQGQSIDEIYRTIVGTYSHRGPSTEDAV